MPNPGDDVLATVSEMLHEVATDHPTITLETRLLEDLGLDSVAQMELLSMIDETLGLEVEMEDVVGLETVGQVVDVVKRYLKNAEA